MSKNKTNPLYYFILALLLSSCTSEEESVVQKTKDVPGVVPIEMPTIITPEFNADSAFFFIESQVDFGPRIPNTKEHIACSDWLQSTLTKYGFEITVQKGKVKAFNGLNLNINNIIGRINVSAENRIMLCAHWDTRPFADRDTIKKNVPIDGANDGASGVGVLLEIARNISILDPETGVDIFFFDAEDYGSPNHSQFPDINSSNDTWCLGSQYWCRNPTFKNYKPRYGILLDMVGAENARFPKEGISRKYANQQLIKVWRTAQSLGFEKYFVNEIAGPITDDHTYINPLAGIPTIDIVHYTPRYNGNFDFGRFHHTHADNMDIIHKPTLKAVGQTIMHIIYQKI